MPVSERRACAALGQHRSTQRKVPRGRDDEERLTADTIALARHRAVRLSQDRRVAGAGGLARQPQAGRADLATRGAEGSAQTTQAWQSLASGRNMHPPAAGHRNHVVLRFRGGPYR